MSLGSKYLARAYDAGRAKIREQNEDCRRGEFLRAIDVDVEMVSDFEASFIESFLQNRGKADPALDFQWFTPKRRDVVDGMIKRYGFRSLKHATPAAVPQAEPGHCGYLKHEDGRRNIPCNAPAVIKLHGGLELCAACDQTRKENIEKLRALKLARMRS